MAVLPLLVFKYFLSSEHLFCYCTLRSVLDPMADTILLLSRCQSYEIDIFSLGFPCSLHRYNFSLSSVIHTTYPGVLNIDPIPSDMGIRPSTSRCWVQVPCCIWPREGYVLH